jgi:hypothetical protein
LRDGWIKGGMGGEVGGRGWVAMGEWVDKLWGMDGQVGGGGRWVSV